MPSSSKRKRDKKNDIEDGDIKSEEESSDELFVRDFENHEENEGEDAASDEDHDSPEEILNDCEYDESVEGWPSCVAYDGAFEQLREDLNSLPREALKIIDASGCYSQRALSLRERADELTRLPRADREKIALLGNTGAGKSSLLNSLLDRPGMARAVGSSFGGAVHLADMFQVSAAQSCTYVCTEYECPFPGQTTELAAKVQYFDIPAIRILLTRLVDDYNVWHFDKPEELRDDEERELKRRSISAMKTFRSLFCDKIELQSTRAATEFFEESHDSTGPDAVAVMTGWCESLLADTQDPEEESAGYLTADTQHDLVQQLKPLTTSSARYEKPALWPLVKNIRVGVRGPRILNFVVLVDLPGLDDTHQVRVNASYDTIRSCDTIWVIAKIARVRTDTTVDALLMRFGKSYNMMVVCTGIDEAVNKGLADVLYEEGQSIGNHNELLKCEGKLKRAVGRQQEKVRSLQAQLPQQIPGRRTKKSKQLSQRELEELRARMFAEMGSLESQQQQLNDITQEKFELLVDVRNAFASRGLKADQQNNMAPNESLEVFCVSNSHYSMLKGTEEISHPRLRPDMTGIPALRKFILERAAPAQLATLEGHIYHRYTVFMKGLAMWAKSYTLDGSDDLLAGVAAPQAGIGAALNRYLSGLLGACNSIIIAAIHDNLPAVIARATKELARKKLLHWCTIRATIRKDGNHMRSVVPQESWNEEFLIGASKVVQDRWNVFMETHDKLALQLQAELARLVADISKIVRSKYPAHREKDELTGYSHRPPRLFRVAHGTTDGIFRGSDSRDKSSDEPARGGCIETAAVGTSQRCSKLLLTAPATSNSTCSKTVRMDTSPERWLRHTPKARKPQVRELSPPHSALSLTQRDR